jgi:nicotinate-nucleotide--dimethylbenzimidazole phosphoribosyltransferase
LSAAGSNPLGRIGEVIAAIGPLDEGAMQAARARQARLTKPPGSLGRLETLSIQLAGITGSALPSFARKAVIVAAADHGVAADGVSAYPPAVTAQMALNFARGGAAINVLARQAGALVVVVDVGIAADWGLPAPSTAVRKSWPFGPGGERPAVSPPTPKGAELAPAGLLDAPGLIHRKIAHGTQNMSHGPAMTRVQAIAALETGLEVFEAEWAAGLDLVATGDMGIGNTTPSAAIVAVLTGRPVAQVTGRGTGVDDAGLARKVAAIEQALAVNRPDPSDALDVLAKVGGFEIGALAGVMLGAAAARVPVVIDGFISGAAALIAAGLAPQVRPYLIAAHQSVEIGHRAALEQLGLRPLFDLELRLGEGTGAVLAFHLVEAAARILSEMATFDEAGVSDKAG